MNSNLLINRLILLLCLFLSFCNMVQAQEIKDTLRAKELQQLEVKDEKQDVNGLRRLSDVENMGIYAGKKNEVVIVDHLNANLATNNARQAYSKVPGIHIVENDGAGIQLGIATRGLNPNRTTEFNTRQNGYDISADPIGYPESYYTPPLEAIDRIEIVRGAASLQYGTQFGGLLNFQFKKGNPEKTIGLTSRQTIGSYGVFSSFNSLGGQVGKVNYYGFYQHKQGDGWRQNTRYNVNTAYGSVNYQLTSKLKIGAELTFMDYLMKQPGGLTDVQFEQDPRASYRNNNWFKAQWVMPAGWLDYQLNEKTKLNLRTYGLIAERGSIGNIINLLKDKQDTTQRRQLTYDHYQNWGTELRLLHRYSLFRRTSSVLVGMRYYRGNTHRQQGSGSIGSSADFDFPSIQKIDEFDYRFPSYNVAAFVENVWWLDEKTSITPGFRFEYIHSRSAGYSNEDVTGTEYFNSLSKKRNFPLFGIGVNRTIGSKSEIYFNISQNYSPVNYADIMVRTPNFQVDPNMKDVKGFNADLGFRGSYRNFLQYDVSGYYLDYDNRIGLIRIASEDGLDVIRYRTNIGRSRSIGLEGFGEINFTQLIRNDSTDNGLSLFVSAAFTDARYTDAINPLLTNLLVNNYVEYAPRSILRSGLTWRKGNFSATIQYSHTAKQFTDAYNSPQTADGLVGPIPAYSVMDISANYQFSRLSFELNVNNITDQRYFTRRALGFPGPGIIPSDGRSGFLTVGFSL